MESRCIQHKYKYDSIITRDINKDRDKGKAKDNITRGQHHGRTQGIRINSTETKEDSSSGAHEWRTAYGTAR